MVNNIINYCEMAMLIIIKSKILFLSVTIRGYRGRRGTEYKCVSVKRQL